VTERLVLDEPVPRVEREVVAVFLVGARLRDGATRDHELCDRDERVAELAPHRAAFLDRLVARIAPELDAEVEADLAVRDAMLEIDPEERVFTTS
jgi:hypothetical protein